MGTSPATLASGTWPLTTMLFPRPQDQGFDFTRQSSRVQVPPCVLTGLTGFATQGRSGTLIKLDQDGFPKDQTTLRMPLKFMDESENRSHFFLYYAAWLVHTPIHTRSQELLAKYCKKLGVDFPEDPSSWTLGGAEETHTTVPWWKCLIIMWGS